MKRKLLQKLSMALLGLTCACTGSFNSTVHAQITGTNEIAFTDFDNFSPGWTYGFFYSWNVPGVPPEPGTYLVDKAYADPLIDPANGPVCLHYTFTNSAYQGPVETNSAGYGTGFGFPVNWGFDPSVFNSVELTDYIFSFDARVEGLAPGRATISCEIQPMIFAGGPKILQKNISYSAGSNWTHYVFTLADGGFGDGTTYLSFTNNIAGITALQVGHNVQNPEVGWDDDNGILLDNIKLEVIQYAGPPPPAPPTVAFAILNWNLDDKPLWYGAGGWNWSENTNLPTGAFNIAATNYGVGGSNAWVMWMTNSSMAADPPDWAGIGYNGVGPGDYTRFDTSDLGAYRFACDARVEGLAADKTSTVYSLQLFLSAPDDTVQPPDAGTDADLILQYNATVPVATDWLTFGLLLKDGQVGGGSKANFTNYFNKINEVKVQFQIDNPNSGAIWEYDDNNALVIDNVKLERIYVGCPPLAITPNGSDVILSWGPLNTAGYVQLQQAVAVNGTYSDVPGATNSPLTLPRTNATSFLRTIWVPPSP